MANRYWVGGTASWDATAGTKWATTSGGAGGAAVPVATDDVYFDGNSGAVTVTCVAGVSTCASLITTGFTGTLNLLSNFLLTNGNVTIGSGTTLSQNSDGLIFMGDASSGLTTITTNGRNVGLKNVGRTCTLADALNGGSSVNVYDQGSGSLDTAGFAITSGASVVITGGNVTLGASVITCAGDISISTAGTVSAASATLKRTGSSGGQINTNGNTVGTLWFAPSAGGAGAVLNIYNTMTIGTLKVTAPASGGCELQFEAAKTYTISTAWDVSGTSGSNKVLLRTTTPGSACNLSKASGSVSGAFLDIKDSHAAGGATFTATSSTDSGGNTGWVFGSNPQFFGFGHVIPFA